VVGPNALEIPRKLCPHLTLLKQLLSVVTGSRETRTTSFRQMLPNLRYCVVLDAQNVLGKWQSAVFVFVRHMRHGVVLPNGAPRLILPLDFNPTSLPLAKFETSLAGRYS
jgi:hypothetical protein